MMGLFSKRYFQRKGVNFSKKFSSAVPLGVLLLIVRKFVLLGRHLPHAEISTAFMSDDVDIELYVKRDSVCHKMKESLY